MTPAINIYKADGTVLMEAVVTKDGVYRESLMTEDCIALRWSALEYTVLPEGAYVIDDAGERYRLIRPYYPSQKDEVRCDYTPEFLSRVMCWEAVPLFFYTYAADGATITSRETEWSLTATPGTFMAYFARVIKTETGEQWSVTVSDDIKLTTASVSFQSTDLLSGLNAVASAFNTEWRADKKTNTLHLGAAAHGAPVRLEVGGNVSVPSTTTSRQEYGTRYYVLGSSRNITQSYEGANVNNLVTRRLTLDPAKYPGGYIDTRPGLAKGEIVPRYLTFDNIYPRSALVAYDVRCRLVYRLDESGSKIQVGTNVDGNPIYDQYAIWYFKAKDKVTGKPYLFDLNDLIKGQTLSVSFLGGALTGRDFELTYHDKDKVVNTSDGTPLQVNKGDFEINFVEEGDYIIPAVTALVPADGDTLTLFNIDMPAEYHASAYLELEAAAIEEINRRGRDLNNYEVRSNPVVFYDNDPGLTIGRNVVFVNVDGREVMTRVLSIARKLDRPCEQTITLGNEVVKGAISEIKDNVVSANTNLAVISQLQELNTAFTQAYTRTQQQLFEGLARFTEIWKLDDEGNVYTERNVYSYRDMVAGGKSATGAGGAGGGASYLFDLLDVSLSGVTNGHALVYRNGKWVNEAIAAGLDTTQLAQYLTSNNYAKRSDIPSLAGYLTQTSADGLYQPKGNYALASDLDGYLPLTGGTLTGPLTMGGSGVKRIYFADSLHYLELDEDGCFYFSHDVYADGDMVAGGKAAGSGIVTVSSLSDLLDVSLSGVTNGHALVYRNGKWVNEAIAGGLDESALASYLSSHNYITSAALNGYATTAQLGNYVTLDTAQTITGAKTFTNVLRTNSYAHIGATSNYAIMMGGGAEYIWIDCRKGTDVINNIVLYTYCTTFGKYIKAPSFVKDGGTSSQFLKADGSVDATQYLYHRRVAAATALNIDTGITATGGGLYEINKATGTLPFAADWHKVFDWGANDNGYRVQLLTSLITDGSLYLRHKVNGTWHPWRTIVDNVNYASILDGRYVKKSGDTMTGALTVPKINIPGTANSTAHITADSGDNIYINVGGKSPLVVNSSQSTVRPSLSLDGVIALGSINARWSTLYANTINVTSTSLVSNLNADMLDGYHASSFLRHFWTNNPGYDCATYAIGSFVTFTYSNNAPFPGGVAHFGTNGYGFYLGTNYSVDGALYYRRHGVNGDGGMGKWQQLARVGDNVASATKLQTSRSLWGQLFNGTADVSGNMTGVGSITATGMLTTTDRFSSTRSTEDGYHYYFNNATVGITGGIGTSTNSGGNAYLWIAGNYAWRFATNSTERMRITGDGNVLIGATTNSSGAKLHVNGNIYSTGENSALSDRRVKSDIRTLAFRGALTPRTYIKDGKRSIGFIAQEVGALYPELVNKGTTPDALWSLNYDAITAVLAAQLNVHEDELTKLRRRVAQLESEIKNYRRA